MELRVLRYFLAVAREETIVGAAQALHITQPTLSRQLMELEQELGVQLFLRSNKKIMLTDEGMLLRKRAQEIIELADKTAAEFSSGGESLGGDVYIGAGETDAMRLIASVIKELREGLPALHFHLFSGNAELVTERLDKGLLDFGVIIEPADIRKYDFFKLPAVDTWGLLVNREHPLAKKESISPADLYELPLYCSRQMQLGNGVSGWLGKSIDELNIVGSYNLIYNAAVMAKEGVACVLTLDKLVNTCAESELRFIPLSPRLEVGIDIVWKKYQVFSRAAELFLNALIKHSTQV